YIKTVSLLPKHEAEKLKAELEGVLIEYALCKATAQLLRELNIGDSLFTRNPAKLEIDLSYDLTHAASELADAISVISDRGKLKQLLEQPPPPTPTEVVGLDYVSVFSKIIFVLKRMKSGGRIEIAPLFADQGRSEQIATFLALLELSSHGRIAFSDELDYIEFTKQSIKEDKV
ncbi:MAG: hypothetical protein FWG83_02980, partial [Oscillospiraceae bacterium]|nr:hypothetical protein [Oscillospiraceae bacterium]